MTAALTMGEFNQSSELFFRFFDLLLSLFLLLLLLLLRWERADFDDRFRLRLKLSAGTRTKSFPSETLRKLAVSGFEDAAGCRLIPRAICSANLCR
jgi:hypothetical protein